MEEEQELHASSADALQTAGTAAAARGMRCEKTGTALPRRGWGRPRDTCPMRAARGGRGHRVSVTTARGPETKRRQLTRVRNGGAAAGPACVSSSIPGRASGQARFHRSCLCLSVRGCRSSRAVPGPRRRPDHRAVGGRVCSAAVSAGARAFRVLSAADAGGLLEAAVTPLAAPTPHCSASGRRFRTLVGN